jgi:hypothetical protein
MSLGFSSDYRSVSVAAKIGDAFHPALWVKIYHAG